MRAALSAGTAALLDLVREAAARLTGGRAETTRLTRTKSHSSVNVIVARRGGLRCTDEPREPKRERTGTKRGRTPPPTETQSVLHEPFTFEHEYAVTPLPPGQDPTALTGRKADCSAAAPRRQQQQTPLPAHTLAPSSPPVITLKCRYPRRDTKFFSEQNAFLAQLFGRVAHYLRHDIHLSSSL